MRTREISQALACLMRGTEAWHCSRLARNLKTIVVLAISAGFAVSPQNAASQTEPAGILEGVFDVNASGAATYSIPIKVPPSVANLTPKIALEYSSQSGNGAIGMGWNLAGLSVILRCARTVAQDGARGGVSYDSGDRYCIDGKKLILSQGPSYHGAGNYYRTEIDSFSRFISVGSTSGAATSFVAESKDGLILEYGATADSRIEASGSSVVRAWALNKVSDRKGNYYTISYYEDGVNPQFYPTHIHYTGTAVGAPKNSIVFDYDTRPDNPALYEAGSVVRTSLKLKSMQVVVSDALYQKYNLIYNTNSDELYPSRLTRIEQCDGAGNCVSPTTNFIWEPPQAHGLAGTGSGVWNGVASSPPNVFTGDFNGDGVADMMSHVSSNSWNVCLSTRANFNCVTRGSHGGGPTNNLLGDFNGDGKTDMMGYTGNGTTWDVCLSNGAGFDCGYKEIHSGGVANSVIGDFDGDGKTDIAGYTGSNSVWHVCLSRVTYFECGYWTAHGAGAARTVTGDFNGDGRTDIARDNGGGNWYICLSTGAGFNCYNRAAHPYGFAQNVSGDFNGDGLTDLAGWTGSGTTWSVCLSTGTGFVCSDWSGNSAGASRTFIADMNGDGKADMVRYNNSAHWYICYSTGKGFLCNSYPGHGGDLANNVIGDFDGDGKVDLTGHMGGASNEWHMTIASGGIRDRVASIKTPYSDDAYAIEYKNLTNPSVYKTDSMTANAAALPIFDSQYAFPVVSAVRVKNGIGGEVTTTYEYGGLKQSPADGRGNLGFRYIKEKNTSTGIVEVNEYLQNWPFAGLVKESRTELSGAGSGGVVKRIINSYAQGLGSTNYSKFVYLAGSTEESWDLNGANFPAVTSTYAYAQSPQYGDPTQISVNVGGATKTTVHEYWPRSVFAGDPWIIGRLKNTTVISTQP